MKRFISFLVVIMLTFSFCVYAHAEETNQKESEAKALSYYVIDSDGIQGLVTTGHFYLEVPAGSTATTIRVGGLGTNGYTGGIAYVQVGNSWNYSCYMTATPFYLNNQYVDIPLSSNISGYQSVRVQFQIDPDSWGIDGYSYNVYAILMG